MLTCDGSIQLKERNGSRSVALEFSWWVRVLTFLLVASRQAIKKYVLANNTINVPSTKAFDSIFNRTLKTGVENGDFTQPKGG